jgi:hypothetical protein
VFIFSPPFTDVSEVWILPNYPAPHLMRGLLGNPLSHGERNQRASSGNMKKKCKLMNSQRRADFAQPRESGIGFAPYRSHSGENACEFAN